MFNDIFFQKAGNVSLFPLTAHLEGEEFRYIEKYQIDYFGPIDMKYK